MKKLKRLKTIYGASCIGIILFSTAQIIFNFKIVDYYLLLVLFFASLGLFVVSLSCIKELKQALKKENLK